MLDKAITGLQILCLLAIMVQGSVFVLTGRQPAQFVVLMWTIIGAGGGYLLLAGLDRVVA